MDGDWKPAVRPLGPGEVWVVWDSRGTYEWFTHPSTATQMVRDGIVLDGEPLRVEVVDERYGGRPNGRWAHGVHLRAVRDSAYDSGYMPPQAA